MKPSVKTVISPLVGDYYVHSSRLAKRAAEVWACQGFSKKNIKYMSIDIYLKLRFAGSVGASSEAMSHRDREQPER